MPEREIRAGYSELVKYGLIEDAGFFAWLERSAHQLINDRAGASTSEAIERAVAGKAGIVARDETEQGDRALLNLGHSFAHAIEFAYAARTTDTDTTMLHGEAVSIGINMAFSFSVALGLCQKSVLERVQSHMVSVGLPVELPTLLRNEAEQLHGWMRHDKKIHNGQLRLVLARDIGQAFIAHHVSDQELVRFLREYGDR